MRSRKADAKALYMRYYMRLKARAEALGITVRELRQREGIARVLPEGELPPPSRAGRRPHMTGAQNVGAGSAAVTGGRGDG